MYDIKLSFIDHSGHIQKFQPINNDNIGLYVCGPTVYDRPHIGNLRSVVVFDIIYRVLKLLYGNVTYVRNITDVDDKIIIASNNAGITPQELSNQMYNIFTKDTEFLGCLKPDIEPKATEHIDDMIEMISSLMTKKHAYMIDGNVMFSVNTYKDYGHISKRNLKDMIAGSRVSVQDYKINENDFVLWKQCDKNEYGWDSPFGYGRPGWHTECAVMSTKYLGYNFDIHGGGFDLQFPHHENEAAQSVCCYQNSGFAKHWIHNGFVSIDGEKMSKSSGRMINLSDLSEYDGNTIRWALMSIHYRKPLNVNESLFKNSKAIIVKLLDLINNLNDKPEIIKMQDNAISALAENINISKYFAIMMSLFRDIRDTKSSLSRMTYINQLYTMYNTIGLSSKWDI